MPIDGLRVCGPQRLDNMRKTLASVAVMLAVGAGGAYLYPSAAILTAIKVRTALSTTQVGPPRDIAWQQGPAAPAGGSSTARFCWVSSGPPAHSRPARVR